MRILCTICARGGSIGIKNKNIRYFRKKPLMAHSIIQAKKTHLFEKIVVSSDSKKIREIGLAWGADDAIERPAEMATTSAGKLPAIQHAVTKAEKIYGGQFDYIIDLDATSPLRTVDDIVNAFNFFIDHKEASNLVTGCVSRKSPYFNMLEQSSDGFVKLVKSLEIPILRRQDAPVCYDMNASIYIWKRETFFNTRIIDDHTLFYTMPEERSIDIDTPLDWQLANLLAQKREDLND